MRESRDALLFSGKLFMRERIKTHRLILHCFKDMKFSKASSLSLRYEKKLALFTVLISMYRVREYLFSKIRGMQVSCLVYLF